MSSSEALAIEGAARASKKYYEQPSPPKKQKQRRQRPASVPTARIAPALDYSAYLSDDVLGEVLAFAGVTFAASSLLRCVSPAWREALGRNATTSWRELAVHTNRDHASLPEARLSPDQKWEGAVREFQFQRSTTPQYARARGTSHESAAARPLTDRRSPTPQRHFAPSSCPYRRCSG